MRQIRMLRAMRRELETGLRRLLHGHAGGNPGHGQGAAYGLPRQFPTLPRASLLLELVERAREAAKEMGRGNARKQKKMEDALIGRLVAHLQ